MAEVLRIWVSVAALGLPMFAAAQPAGFVPERRYELSGSVEVDRADSTTIRLLDQAKAYLADHQFSEGIDLLLAAMEKSGTKLIAVNANRYIPVCQACQLEMISLPPGGLELYRRRVDGEAERLYEEGVARRDASGLMRVVDRYLASRWADNALDALAEMALESGDSSAARSFWQRIFPATTPNGERRTWLGVPDTDMDLAGVRARLVLASIVEGSTAQAAEELSQFRRLHPGARGWLGGREGDYADTLSALLAESGVWPRATPRNDWPTFAGAPSRNAAAGWPADASGPSWRVRLKGSESQRPPSWNPAAWRGRVAEDTRARLSFFPAVSAGKVFVNRGNAAILALNLVDGRPAWGRNATVFEDESQTEFIDDPQVALGWGVPRHTVTVHGDRLYARMGSPLTSRPRGTSPTAAEGYLICLDLASQGRLAWKILPEPGWAFEGSPVADDASAYVVMRRSEVQPQVHLACYAAETGELRWRRFICAADTPARGALPEITYGLATLHRDTLYLNTNLGAIAAVEAANGSPRWVTTYARALKGDLGRPPAHACRDLTPCLYDRGTLYVAPADTRSLFALDAATGQILWQSGPEFEDVVHLLGVSGDCLIASGDRLYWINVKGPERGRLKHVWPDGATRLGFGRGLLAGNCVLWPTRERIYQFDKATGRLEKSVDLAAFGVRGGNLFVAEGRILVATSDELVALGRPQPAADPNPTLARHAHSAGEEFASFPLVARERR